MSSFFDKIFRNIFQTDNPATGVAVREVLRRSNNEKHAYDTWKSDPLCFSLLQEINQAYYYKKTGIRSDIIVHLFQSDYANGFAVNYHPSIGKRNFQHLFDLFKERVAAMDYRMANADRQIIDKKSYVETREKYYLKPPLNFQDSGHIVIPTEQLYGNISIEHVLTDNQPQYIKVLVSIYSDRSYKHAQSYDEFVARLLEASESQ